jgi:hypothetical protein
MSEHPDSVGEDTPDEGVPVFLSSKRQKKAEVEALMRCHGLTLEQACELVCYEPEEYLRSPPPDQSRIKYLPLPDQILDEAERLRFLRKEEPTDII